LPVNSIKEEKISTILIETILFVLILINSLIKEEFLDNFFARTRIYIIFVLLSLL